MSAYIVDDETINRIVAGLSWASEFGEWDRPLPKPTSKKLNLVYAGPDAFGNILRNMNAEAVSSRYPNDNPDELPGPVDSNGKNSPYQYHQVEPPSPVQMVKSLQCYLYQCAEGNVPENNLYKALDAYVSELCIHIVTNSAEYSTAKWG